MNYILSIAIDNYDNPAFLPLNNSVQDAKKLEYILTTNYEFSESKSLFNEDANRVNIIESLNQLVAELTPDDSLIIYFAGHGTIHPITNKGYWIPQDASNRISDFVPNSTIIDIVSGIQAKHILLIIDSCFSGAFLSQTRSINNFHYAKLNESKSRWVISSGRNEKVSDGIPGVGSPFSVILNNFLNTNISKPFSFLELANAVSKGTGSNTKQQPIFAHIEGVGHNDGQMVFNLNKNTSISVIDSSLLRIVVTIETAKKLKAHNFPQNSIFGYYQENESTIIKRYDSDTNFICSAYTYEEIVLHIPEEIEVDKDTYLARANGYDKLEVLEFSENDFAYVSFERPTTNETPFMAICKCRNRMVAFSTTEDGYYNNLICWGETQAESAALMIIELINEKKIQL